MKNANRLLCLLVENEIFRLTVWNNPLSDVKRFVDPFGSLERIMVEVCMPALHLVFLAHALAGCLGQRNSNRMEG